MTNLRDSGIEIIGKIPWGSHICQFYQSREDLLEVLVPFFKAGLEGNEFCMWITSDPLTPEIARDAMSGAVNDFDRLVEEGRMKILPHDRWYLIDGVFDMDRVFDGWKGELAAALERGLDGLRATGNTAWLESDHWGDFTEYEETLNNIIGGYDMMAVCTYSLDLCNAHEVIDVVSNHQFAMIKRDGAWKQIESSERKKNIQALEESEALARRQAEMLARSNAELRGFAHAASHDLQEPLRTITSFVQALTKKYQGRLDEEADEYMRFIVDGAARMRQLIDGLLEYSLASSQGLVASEVAVGRCLDDARCNLASLLEKSGAQVVYGDLPVVNADETMLIRLFQNLIGNSVKFRGEEPPRIEIDAQRDDGCWVFTVRDNGIGFSPRYSERIFEMFQRLHPWSQYEGTGMGLAICKSIVERHGGRIWAESRDGRGCCFHFTLPAHGVGS